MQANVKALLAAGGAAVAISFSAGAAQAASMFDLTSGGPTSFTADGINLTVAAFDEDGDPATVAQNGFGIGVFSGGIDLGQLDNGIFGGGNDSESLKFTFDQPIRLISALFTLVNFNDDYSLLDGSGTLLVDDRDIPGSGLGSGLEDFTAFLSLEQRTGSMFTFTVPSGNRDSYRLSSLEVEAVPTPAILPGLLGLGLSLARKRKKQELEAAA